MYFPISVVLCNLYHSFFLTEFQLRSRGEYIHSIGLISMTSVVKFPYKDEEMSVWLRGLLTIAWADGNFDPQEQQLIACITESQLTAQAVDFSLAVQPISPSELAAVLGKDAAIAENFLRTAVMVALADGVYSAPEDDILHQFYAALGQKVEALEILRQTLYQEKTPEIDPQSSQSDSGVNSITTNSMNLFHSSSEHPAHFDVLHPVRDWLDHLDIHDPRLARFLCKMIPPQCPFERDIKLFGHKIVRIPPLCKLNPLYEQLVYLRFRALSYLADDCHEDISAYC